MSPIRHCRHLQHPDDCFDIAITHTNKAVRVYIFVPFYLCVYILYSRNYPQGVEGVDSDETRTQHVLVHVMLSILNNRLLNY